MTILHGDCIDVMAQLPAASIDAVVTDPPYAIGILSNEWDKMNPLQFETWCAEWATECFRVLKPGGYLAAFGATRTYHRLAAGIEDGGFRIRDTIAWLYTQGFPASLDVSDAVAAYQAGDRDPRQPAEDPDRPDVLAITAFLRDARIAAGWTNARIDALFGTTGMAGHWTTQASQPLADLGYDAAWHSLRAADIGAPHGRLRYFVVAADTRGQSWLERRLATAGQAPRGGALGEPAGRDRASVTLLPTPTTQDGANTAGPSTFHRNSLPLNAVATLLPTPRPPRTRQRRAAAVRDGEKGGPNHILPTPRATRGGSSTETVALLPTPTTEPLTGNGHARNLGNEVQPEQWGPYAAAIRRWERIVGPAPAPTITGRTGNPRLNPEFALWMMGVPAGWVTDVPNVTDNEALRLAGNGVCPQQAAAALTTCLNRFIDGKLT